MFPRFRFAFTVIAGFLGYVSLSAPAQASDIVYPGGGTLSQIVDGGGTYTIITLVNLQSTASSYTLEFYSESGTPLLVSTTTGGLSSSISGTLPVGGSTIIQTNGTYAQNNCPSSPGLAGVCGYAVLATAEFEEASTGAVIALGNQIAGSAVFSLPLATGVVAQASCPLDTGADYIFGIPFDETGDATSSVTGLAIVNSPYDAAYQPYGVSETALVNVSFLDQNGNPIPTPAGQVPTIILPAAGHTSFMLDANFPQVVGQKGTAIFQGSDANGYPYVIKVLGLRATPTTFTSITPLVPCNPQVGTGGVYDGCGN